MPRQRKPQNSGQRLWTGRVANTTTGSTTTQVVYRIKSWNKYWECEVLNYEVVWTSPIVVRIEWENVYRVSLDEAALKKVIESYPNLTLDNVTLTTVNGDVEFTGSVTADWTFTANEVVATTVTAETTNTEDLNVSWDASIDSADINSLSATSWNITSLTADGITTEDLTTTWDVTMASALVTDLTATNATVSALTATDATITDLSVTGETELNTLEVNSTSTFTGAITAWDASITNLTVTWNEVVNWNTTLNTLTVTWSSTLHWTTVDWNLSVTWNSTVSWNSTVTWTSTFNWAVTMADDVTIVDDLTVNWTTHLNWLETSWSVDIAGTLRVDWAIDAGNWIVVTGQMESDTVRTTEVVTNELRVLDWLYLAQWAEAPDFVLQSEKGQPNGVAPLNANGKVDPQYLPDVFTTAIVKVGTWIFSNSDTSVVTDAAITADSFVVISNYSDIVWDLNEVINIWQLTVVSNQTETWSYKYIVVNPLQN